MPKSFTKFKSFLPIMGITILSACNHSSSSDIKNEETSESYSYSYEVNRCQTGRQEFSSKDAYCAGLQNETLNKGCALTLRKKAFSEMCSGTFQSSYPSSTDGTQHSPQTSNQPDQDQISNQAKVIPGYTSVKISEKEKQKIANYFNNHSMAIGTSKLDVPVFSRSNNGIRSSQLLFVSCAESLDSALFNRLNGAILLRDSTLMITRDLSYQFGDGTSASAAQPYSVNQCSNPTASGDTSKNERTTQKHDDEIEVHNLKVGTYIQTEMKTSPEGQDEAVALAPIFCVHDQYSVLNSALPGMSLFPGSRLVIKQRQQFFMIQCDK